MKKFSALMLIVFCFFLFPCYKTQITIKQLDSLKQELNKAGSDTARLRIRNVIGYRFYSFRKSYWDSIAFDARKLKAVRIEGRAYFMIGGCYTQIGVTDSTLEYLLKSLKCAEIVKNEKDQLNALFGISNCYNFKGDFKNAIDYGYKAVALAEKAKITIAIAIAHRQVGDCYFNAGDFNNALIMHLKALKYTQARKDPFQMASTLNVIANDYRGLKKDSMAAIYYIKSKEHFDHNSINLTACELNNGVGAGYSILKQYDSAAKYSLKAYIVAKNSKNEYAITSVLSNLAEIYYKKGDISNAKKYATESIKLAKANDFKTQIPGLSLLLKEIYLKEGNAMAALKAYELHVTSLDSLSNEKNRKLLAQKEFDYQLGKKESENKLLAQQNQIQALQITQNKYVLFSLIGLFLLGLIISFLFIRQNKLKAEQKSTQLEQKLLRSQMNPHFIFNSLQAIQSYVRNHQTNDAINYLNSFANVTRNVLEGSRLETISLNKEINLLENYLQLQQARFSNRFKFEIHVDENIDTENTLIPPMLAQPFIENAVEHGFYGIENGGLIKVQYKIISDMLAMEISDNGVGMQEGSTGVKQHRSLALEITKERVALMNKKAKQKTSFSISDTFPLLNERKGVKVNFSLPLDFVV